jgi:hypothetical protein
MNTELSQLEATPYWYPKEEEPWSQEDQTKIKVLKL